MTDKKLFVICEKVWEKEGMQNDVSQRAFAALGGLVEATPQEIIDAAIATGKVVKAEPTRCEDCEWFKLLVMKNIVGDDQNICECLNPECDGLCVNRFLHKNRICLGFLPKESPQGKPKKVKSK